ncbi:hypothetical protein [Zhihengliuella salsuginis]|uniref:hypothetical protein n=1 Tax=Zhihengliuella salsuginis TaxID=578222 RepID=UPI001678344F|nr:hypothetical protein [Zhihengliuella salsuginis]
MFRLDDAVRAGMTPDQLRGRMYERIGRSVYRRRDTVIRPVDVYAAFSRSSPDTYLSHTSAALAWGIWLPPRIQPGFPIHLSRTGPDRTVPRQKNVIGHWSSAAPADVREIDGFRIASPALAWTQLAGSALGLEDLVVAGDALLQDPDGPPRAENVVGTNPLATTEELERLLQRRAGFRGRRLAMEALPLLRARADSRPESIVRQRLIRQGFPESEANPVLGFVEGRRIRPDLADRVHRIAVQYEGKQHNEEAQLGRDILRDADLERIGWISVRTDKAFFTPRGEQAFFDRLRAAYDKRGVIIGRVRRA